ncbi:deoxynucleoside kinase [Acholeplasma granularum]|uniref:deoxynucleoside kinase n=1 Tax=Acholeplasma granularum TaxID=264635 RepID=UPI00046E5974|nr:deoxynucleoside kinase [Acholeplasma granularum]
MLIVIGGMIGLGKTSIGEILAEEFKGKMYYESVDDNPILPLYYTASEEETKAKRYPFLLQLWFLNSRFKALKDAAKNATSNFSVVDRSIYEDWYFAKTNFDLGRMNQLEFDIYSELLDNMMEEIESLPKKSPDLMIYLKGSFESVLDRIKSRGRAFEIDDDLKSYYKRLWDGYDNWLEEHYKFSDCFIIDTDKYNVVHNLDDRKIIINQIKEKLKNK